jgi:formate dehydrogenase iron-sulfur subunit
VSACPEGAIAIEIVNVADWRTLYAEAVAAPGIPSDDHSMSTTRITMPDRMPPNAKPTDLTHVKPDAPHWPLVVMTVLTQLSVGAFVTIWVLELLGASTRLGLAALTSLTVGGLALTASTLHLGRPIHAYRALKMWRRSWLSREVLLFASFSGVATLDAGALWFGLPGSSALGGLTMLLGLAGVTASACIYRVPSRPAWNTRFTLAQFNLTALTLGPLLAAAIGAGDVRWLGLCAACGAGAQLLLLAVRFFRLTASDGVELRGTARLLSTVLMSRLVARGVLLAIGGVVLPLIAGSRAMHPAVLWLAFALALGAEIIGRYLFFVSVVPKHMAAPYLAMESEAA